MSGDVQPRKRKDKRKKKGTDDEEILQHHGSFSGPDEVIHIHKENKLGGNICSKIVFFGLLGILCVMVGLIIIEYHGTNDMDTQSAEDSPWSVILDGWVDKPGAGHDDEHLSHDEEQNQDQHDEHDGEHNHDEEHDQLEAEYSEGEHEEEQETEEEVENVSFAQRTYEDLRAAYNQISPEGSDAEPSKDDEAKTEDYGTTESESEPSGTEEDEEDEVQGDDPLGQWKSTSGPELLAEEVEEAQAESEAEEESDDEVPSTFARTGPQSIDNVDQDNQEDKLLSDSPAQYHEESEETYEFADITNQVDWEIKEELDEAERDLDEADFHL